MIIITIQERMFKKNDITVLAEEEEKVNLISSFDYFNDNTIEKDQHGVYYFIDDTLIKFYNIFSDCDDNEEDDHIVQTIKDYIISYPKDIRKLFDDLPLGKYQLKTSWDDESDDVNYLIFDGIGEI